MLKPLKTMSAAALAAVLLTATPLGAFADENTVVTGVKAGTFRYYPLTGTTATDNYYFSDSYFSQPAGENSHLAAMSMALSLSVMENRGSDHVTGLLTDIGFKDISVSDIDGVPGRDTIGSAIAHKTAGNTELIAVAIRGGAYEAEWASNLTAGAEGNIKGFDEAKEKVLARLKDYIEEHDLKNVKIWITGYSRAGAVADLAGAYIDSHPDEFGTAGKDLFVYTFESPRASADPAIHENIFNYRNKNDLVNYVYPEEWGIYSCGKDVWLGTDETIETKIFSLGSSETIVPDGTVSQADFCRAFAEMLNRELSREKFSGDFDKAVADILEIVFRKPEEERREVAAYIGGIVDLSGGMAGLMSDPALLNIVLNDIISGILMHDTDEVYEKLAGDMRNVIAGKYAADVAEGKDVPLTEEEMNILLDSLYPVLRRLGEVVVSDYYYHAGMDTEQFFPDGYRGDTPSGSETSTSTPDRSRGYALGKAAGESAGEQDAANKSEYRAGYDDTPAVYGSQQLTDEYAAGWKDGYAFGYDSKFGEKPLYHVATFAANAEKILDQHRPPANWELIKQADNYYSGKYTFSPDDPGKEERPAEEEKEEEGGGSGSGSENAPAENKPRNDTAAASPAKTAPAVSESVYGRESWLSAAASGGSQSGSGGSPASAGTSVTPAPAADAPAAAQNTEGSAAPAAQSDGGTAPAAAAAAENSNPPTGAKSSVYALFAVLAAGMAAVHRKKS